ncbi:PetM of cytochrome b6f complex subunit 7 [Thalassoporum mexicanum PCC 7367]|nr:PetM family cytochrome b6-f complex subunit 7 [Pseudanabaena sp. PCC 7367]AFY69098.1 PetM of cytochrome b6f complex subunit 7 [Pseudanabaena sp. PCC 7367]
MGEFTNALVIPVVMVMVGIAFGYFLLNAEGSEE